ncbi:Esterase/lipase [Chitinophaga costaii]|uniref:Esterase/lipase n=1 Tax=Chitinophaga costaii TaxID=1335309 RepID=A0A1C4CF98_9BACT|nr:alpha/beta hydrolase [Chitinophaga costaii]PUZ27303.1 alpha/beta hydrolase [Chitinophaga costaii]SCC17801.1 Esterase/lipase [Chitinophaga costaii]
MPIWLRTVLSVTLLLGSAYLLGPCPPRPQYSLVLPSVPQNARSLMAYIQSKESQHCLKPDNQARIVWCHGDDQHKTEYSIVYLHGFSASQEEGDPVHRRLAARYGCNLFLTRLDGHGLDTAAPLLTMTATGLWEDAKEALQIGKALGHKVILVGTSTGGTLALLLAAKFPADVYAVINMSPNIEINQPLAFLANNHWGLAMSRMIKQSDYNIAPAKNEMQARYWYTKYRLEAVSELEELLESSMTPGTFQAVHQPVLNLYYYKNQQEQDPTVRVSAILNMQQALGTPDSLKLAVAIPNAGTHVLGCALTSKDIPAVETAIYHFMENTLHLRPLED